VTAPTMRYRILAAAVVGALAASACSEQARQGRSPAQVVVVSLLSARATSSATPTAFLSGPLNSDVPDAPGETVFNDFGQVTMRLVMRDPGQGANPATPTPINEVTMTSYRVEYRRTDGRNTPGVDVPFAFTGAITMTVPTTATAAGVFELVRHIAKVEPPLAVLGRNPVVLTVIADVTFFGRDQAGNAVSASGSIQINFANFA
jgi:hypothetical protein